MLACLILSANFILSGGFSALLVNSLLLTVRAGFNETESEHEYKLWQDFTFFTSSVNNCDLQLTLVN